jgi:hypothetical protein
MILDDNELPMMGSHSGSGLVELHWGVFPGGWLRYTTRINGQVLWKRAVPITLAGQQALMLAPEDQLLQLAVHAAINHNLSLPWLRSLMDIALLARHYSLDWKAVVQRARAWRVATAVWVMLHLVVDLAGLDEAQEVVRQLQPSTLRRRMLQRFVNADNQVAMRDLSVSRWRFVLLLLLVDRRRDAIRLIFRTLWPEREWLQARYGRAGVRVRVKHLLNALRGRI